MRITTKGRLAVVAMIDVAVRGRAGPVTLAGISVRHSISVSYLEQMFGQLRRNGLVRSTRGPGGGYRLARPASSITVADIVLAADKRATEPESDDRIARGSSPLRCATPELWADVAQQAMTFLGSVSLQSMVDQAPVPAAEPVASASKAAPAAAKPGRFSRLASPIPKVPNSVFALGKFVGV